MHIIPDALSGDNWGAMQVNGYDDVCTVLAATFPIGCVIRIYFYGIDDLAVVRFCFTFSAKMVVDPGLDWSSRDGYKCIVWQHLSK